MRVLLTGSAGSVNTYYVRVRSNSADLNNLTGGITKGSYVLQVRLQEIDQFAGSTIRYADIRYANNGIEIIGKPQQSALVSNTKQTTIQMIDEPPNSRGCRHTDPRYGSGTMVTGYRCRV